MGDWWWICAGHCGLHGVSVPGAVSAFLCRCRVSLSSPLLHLRARFYPSFIHPHRSDGESSSGHQQSFGVRNEGVEWWMSLSLTPWELCQSPFEVSSLSAHLYNTPGLQLSKQLSTWMGNDRNIQNCYTHGCIQIFVQSNAHSSIEIMKSLMDGRNLLFCCHCVHSWNSQHGFNMI